MKYIFLFFIYIFLFFLPFNSIFMSSIFPYGSIFENTQQKQKPHTFLWHKVGFLVLGVSRQTFLSRGLILDQMLALLVVPLSGLPAFSRQVLPLPLYCDRGGEDFSGAGLQQVGCWDSSRIRKSGGALITVMWLCVLICMFGTDHCTRIDR